VPSGEHESPIELAKLDPSLLVWLAGLFNIDVPKYHHVRPYANDIRVLVPHTYHTDSILLFCDQDDQPLLAVVWEPHRDDNDDKLPTWKLYVAQIEKQIGVTCVLLVYCPDPAHARSFRKKPEVDRSSLWLRPFFVTPEDVPLVTDIEQAQANPSVVVFSALCHGDDKTIDAMFPALAAALRMLSPTKAIAYYDIVLAGLPVAARARWEAHMTTAVNQYRSELFRTLATEAEAHGEAQAILTVLNVNGVEVPEGVRQQIVTCTDLDQLEIWLRRAVKAATIDDVLCG
jgi:hypothetical protein